MGVMPWKVVTLAEDHLETNVGNQTYWMNYLDISNQNDLDQYTYLCIFFDNSLSGDTTYKAEIIAYRNETRCTICRNNFAYASAEVQNNTSNYNLYATQGTKIEVYKILR